MEDDDVVSYKIYPAHAEDLEELRERCLALVCRHVIKYIWHKDRFMLSVDLENHCLSGRVHFAENVEDEWFVVALLRDISLAFQDVVIRVVDGDGEILLIEAADCLPLWAQEPDLAEKRAYLHRGSVHLIPLPQRPSELTPLPSGVPNVEAAVETVRHYSNITLASCEVQAAVQKRLLAYPADWSSHRHSAHLVLPLKAALVLNSAPLLITAAVQCLANMDAVDARRSSKMKTFPQKDMVKSRVTMTKCLYAMLCSRNVWPARDSCWQLSRRSEDEVDFREKTNGFKVALGLEIILSTAQGVASGDIEHVGARYAFVKKLIDLGYFRDLLPGSVQYNALLGQADSFYRDSCQSDIAIEQDPARRELADVLNVIANSSPVSLEDFEKKHILGEADDESWLDMDKSQFDSLLEKHFKSGVDGSQILGSVEQFLEQSSDMKGIELNDEGQQLTEEDMSAIDFHADDLQSALESLLAKVADGDEDGEEDVNAIQDYFEEMELQLKDLSVREDVDASLMMDNFSLGAQESFSGPANTLFSSVLDK